MRWTLWPHVFWGSCWLLKGCKLRNPNYWLTWDYISDITKVSCLLESGDKLEKRCLSFSQNMKAIIPLPFGARWSRGNPTIWTLSCWRLTRPESLIIKQNWSWVGLSPQCATARGLPVCCWRLPDLNKRVATRTISVLSHMPRQIRIRMWNLLQWEFGGSRTLLES